MKTLAINSKLIIFLGVLTLITGSLNILSSPSYAGSLQLIGDKEGLIITPSKTGLFNLKNMNPGDSQEEKVYIKNLNKCKLELFIITKRTSPTPLEGEADLFKQLILSIYYGEELLYHGPMDDFAQEKFSLGELASNSEKELRAIVHLPGPETGNEFQGKELEVEWIFIAEERCDSWGPEDPKDPEKPEDPENPKDPEEPRNPENPEEPSQPHEPEAPQDPEEPREYNEVEPPIGPGEMEEPTEGQIKGIEPPEDGEYIEIIEGDIPEGTPEGEIETDPPTLPKTGSSWPIIYYFLGTLLIYLGWSLKSKEQI